MMMAHTGGGAMGFLGPGDSWIQYSNFGVSWIAIFHASHIIPTVPCFQVQCFHVSP
jgi:hypothetical protein